MNIQENFTTHDHSRRSWLGGLIGLIGGAIAAILGISLGRFAVAPAFKQATESTWIELGAISAIPEKELVRKTVVISQDAGWGKFQSQRTLWVIRNGEDIKIFSGVCPHLGCSVNAKEDLFICACHGSKWNQSGEKTLGPAPRALDSLTHKIETGILKVQYQDFKQGIETKEVLS